MSQFNSSFGGPSVPNSGSNLYAAMNPYASMAPSRPACKWAGILQIVVGGLLIVFSTCLGISVTMLNSAEMPPETREQLQQVLSQTKFSMKELQVITAIFVGACMFLPAAVMIVLGIFVLRANRFCVITSIVLTSLSLLVVLLFIVSPLLSSNPARIGVNACLGVLPLAGLGCLLVMLIQAGRELSSPLAAMASPSAQSAQAQYQQQWAAYYQQYNAWQQSQQQQQPQPPVPSTPPAQPLPPAPGNEPPQPPQAPNV